MRVSRLLLAVVTLALASCADACGEPPLRCREDATYWPRCDGNEIAECFADRVETSACEGDEICVGGQKDGMAWAGCIPADAETCERETFVSACVDDTTYRECGGGILFPSQTRYTDDRQCGEGLVCLDDPAGARCVPPGVASCDPEAEPAHWCDGQVPTRCTASGYTEAREECSDGRVCQVGEAGAVCVEPDATPCDPSAFGFDHCVEGHVRDCDFSTRFTEVTARCADDEACFGDTCLPADTEACERDSVREKCGADGTERLRCDVSKGAYLPTPCENGGFCVETDFGSAVCVAEDAEACNPDTYVPVCLSDSKRRYCSGSTGYTTDTDCTPCRTSDAGGFCVPATAEICDPRTYRAGCETNTATGCDIASHFTYVMSCPPDYVCVADELMGTPLSACVPDDWPPCTEPAQQSCAANDTWQWCVGGRLLAYECGDAYDCVSVGDRAECVSIDAPACDSATYVPSCEPGEVLVECFGGREFRTRCANVALRCDAAAGACVE